MYDNTKKLFLFLTLFTIIIGLSATYATDLSDDGEIVDTIDEDVIQSNEITTDNSDNVVKSEDNSKKIVKNNNNKNLKVENQNIVHINNDNANEYFDIDSGEAYNIGILSDSQVYLDEEISDVSYWYFDQEVSNIKFTSSEVIHNQGFIIESEHFTFDNINFEYDEEFELDKAIYVLGDYFVLNNSAVLYNPGVIGDNLNSFLVVESQHSTISNTLIDANIIATAVDWNVFTLTDRNSLPSVVPVVIKKDYANISNLNLTTNVKKSDYEVEFPSVYSIAVIASYVNITESNFDLIGDIGYVYNIYVTNQNSLPISNITIANSNVSSESAYNFSSGIYFDGSGYENNTVFNNSIFSKTSLIYKEGSLQRQDVSYSVVITNRAYTGGHYTSGVGNVNNTRIINNTIISEGHQSYGIEQFGGDNTTISGNTIIATGSYSQAIGIIGFNSTVVNNTLTAIGENNLTESTVDYLPAVTTGVQLIYGNGNNISNNIIESTKGTGILIDEDNDNTIESNDITVYGNDYSIVFSRNANNNEVLNNNLETTLGKGSITVSDDKNNNNIGDNNDPEIIYTIDVEVLPDDLVATVGQEAELIVIVENAEGSIINEGSIELYVNDELFDSQLVEDGIVLFSFETPINWYNPDLTISVKYTGSETFNTAESNVDYIISGPTEIVLNSQSTSVYVNSNPIDISATLVDVLDNTVNSDIEVYINNVLQDDSVNLFNPQEIGVYEIKYVFNGDLNDALVYLPSENSITITVNIIPTTIVEDTFTVIENENTPITITVIAEDDSVINDGIIELVDSDNNLIATSSVENGKANIILTLDTIGQNTYTASFKNSLNYDDSLANVVITVTKAPKKSANIVLDDVEVTLSAPTTIVANVIDDEGNLINQGKVSFKINGKTLKDANGKIIYTNVVNGKASVTYDIPSNLINESTNITAQYSGSVNYNQATSQQKNIVLKNSEVSLDVDTSTAKINENIQFSVKINTDKVINNGRIVVKVNGKTLKDDNGKVIYATITDSIATINYNFSSSLYKAKDYVLTAIFTDLSGNRIESNTTITLTN